METYIIAYDLGTGGNKSSLYDSNGNCIAECFESYQTDYPKNGWHEQQPEDWWNAVVLSTRKLIKNAGINQNSVTCCGISGHSLGVVPIDQYGRLLRNATPIWSDSRAADQARSFFSKIPETDWYHITGNGFPAPLYSVFKIMWYRDHEPEMFNRIHKVIGTKDFINLKLTGFIGTDFSYASGSGVYDLTAWKYNDRLIVGSGLDTDIFPEIVPSTQIIGTLSASAAEQLGLSEKVKVVSGGVDNSCMALGARNTCEGRVYNSQGSSSWIAVTSNKPLIDVKVRPFVFTHVLPGLFTSAVSTFAAGTSFRWVRDHFCHDLQEIAERDGNNVYDLMTARAASSPTGANHLLFSPNMAGGTSMNSSPNIRGAFLGLDLSHTQADVIRATMEGIAFELRVSLDALRKLDVFQNEMLVVGGGSHSALWRQIFADIYEMNIIKTNIDQQAAALGAAACAAVGTGVWENFEFIDQLHHIESVSHPIQDHMNIYREMLPIFKRSEKSLAEIGDLLATLKNR